MMNKKAQSLQKLLKISKKYKYLKDFREKESSAYRQLSKLKKLHLIRKWLIVQWEPLTEAKPYKEWSELQKNKGLYSYLRRNKLLNHPKLNHIKRQKTFEQKMKELLKDIKKYKYLDELYWKHRPSKTFSKWHHFIRAHNLLPLIKKKLIVRGHPLTWSRRMLKEELKKYSNVRKLKREQYALFERALYYGMIQGKHKNHRTVYSKEYILELCKGCQSIQEFTVKHKAAHNYVIKHNIKLPLPDLSQSTSVGERVLRQFMETAFKAKFEKARPEFMRSPLSKRKLELDGYCPELKLAFEHQGLQHYQNHFFYTKSSKQFEDIQRNDKLKLELCQKEGIALLQIPDILNTLKFNEKKIKQKIASEMKKHSLAVPSDFWKIPLDFKVKPNPPASS